MRFFPPCASIFVILVGISIAQGQQAAKGRPDGLPAKLLRVDTRALMASPAPLPLEASRAFRHLQFQRPVEFTHADDGSNRVFVVEQRGVIRRFENRDDVKEAAVFLDIRQQVLSEGNEEGLLGLAFHPRFKENGEFFVYYSARPRSSVISRFRVSKDDPRAADRASEERLLVIKQPYENHNGGSIRFGPDGYLYIGLGDGGAANDPHGHAQDLSTLLGSILRIDVDRRDQGLKYAIPQDNPFVSRPGARGEIWAYGLRNVWRLSFDRKTGDLWAGDVGQDRFEEVNLIRRGGNYGWNVREGFHPFDPNSPSKLPELIDPLAEYFRHEGESVTGGLVYRGQSLPKFVGAYFYGDFVSGNVWTLRWDGKQVVENRQVAKTGLEIAAFGEDQQGEMFLCAFDGHLYRLRPRAIDPRAVAAFPRKLSDTGLLASVKENRPAPGLIPYEVNVPFWSDYAVKDRYIALPEKGSVRFHEREKWEFPVGTVFVKTFWMHRDRVNWKELFRLETRLFVHAPDGWVGYTYVYNEDESEAHLLDASQVKHLKIKTSHGQIEQPYYFPSRSDCMACHTKAEGFVLGTTTRQMNRTQRYRGDTENQLEMLSRLGVFTEKAAAKEEAFPDWGFGNYGRSGQGHSEPDLGILPKEKSEPFARAWLEVNCAVCHRPKGIAPHERDLRFHTPLEKMNLVGKRPSHVQLSPPGSALLRPGAPELSELLFRAGHRGPQQMPPLASKLVDPHAMDVLREWILGMKSESRSQTTP